MSYKGQNSTCNNSCPQNKIQIPYVAVKAFSNLVQICVSSCFFPAFPMCTYVVFLGEGGRERGRVERESDIH
jgi:hypothetical protein